MRSLHGIASPNMDTHHRVPHEVIGEERVDFVCELQGGTQFPAGGVSQLLAAAESRASSA